MGRLVIAVTAALLQRGAGYDYGDIVAQYCHIAGDWGPIPPRPEGAGALKQVQVFVRHGARAQCNGDFCWSGDHEGNFTCSLNYLENSVDGQSGPLTPFFRTVYLRGRNTLPGNCLLGQLVDAGFEMERANGRRLREAYVDREGLLPKSLDGEALEDFYFRSTEVPRTKQSGMALVSGLYADMPPKEPFITLQTMDMAEENMLVNPVVCPAVGEAGTAFFAGLPSQRSAELVGLCSQLNPAVAKDAKTCFWWLQHLVDCLMSRTCPTVPFHPRNATVPGHFLADDAALMRRVWRVVDEVQFEFFGRMRDAGAFGPLVSEILAASEAAVAGGPARKFLLYSGHDTGPMEPLYATFGLRAAAPFWPSFASMLVLELWEAPGGPIARWISNGEVVSGPVPYADFRAQASAVAGSGARCGAGAPPPALAPRMPWISSEGFAMAALAGSLTVALVMGLWARTGMAMALRGPRSPSIRAHCAPP